MTEILAMEVITIESKAFKHLMEKLEALSEYVYSMERPAENNDDEWVDSQEVCRFLKISERTLQRLRTSGRITHSCLGGKYYYQITHIKALLRERVIKSTGECLQELIEHHQYSARKK